MEQEPSNSSFSIKNGLISTKSIYSITRHLSRGDISGIHSNILTRTADLQSSIIHDQKLCRNDFRISEFLGKGFFGMVYKGEIYNKSTTGSKICVAIKTTSGDVTQPTLNSFSVEIDILQTIGFHYNLVNMYGYKDNISQHLGAWIVLEYCNEKDLLQFLSRNRTNIINSFQTPSNNNKLIHDRMLITLTFDIASGMEHLARKQIMHGDLAARNILISRQYCSNGSGLVAKVADFGLAKNFSNNTTYTKTHRKYLPWKWMVELLSCISIGNI